MLTMLILYIIPYAFCLCQTKMTFKAIRVTDKTTFYHFY